MNKTKSVKGVSYRFICPFCGEAMSLFTHAHANKHGFNSKEELIEACGDPKKVVDPYIIPNSGEIRNWLKGANTPITGSTYNQLLARREAKHGIE